METRLEFLLELGKRIKEFLCKRVGISWRTFLCIVLVAILVPSVGMNIFSAANYNQILHQVNQRSLQCNASVFIQPECSDVMQLTDEITYGWNNQSDWNEFWKDIFKLYSWVDQNISYNHDTYSPILPNSLMGQVRWAEDVWQYPDETLALKRGDCEDMAILLCSMILNYIQERLPCEAVLIAGSEKSHVGLQLVFDQNITILDTALNYYTGLSSGNITKKYTDSEIARWISRFSLDSDTEVTRVFSSSFDKKFSTTNEYLSWMHTREGHRPP